MFRVLLAMAVTILRLVTGIVAREAGASLGIGLLLVSVAFRLGRDARDQLIGESAHPRVRRGIEEFLSAREQIDNVAALLTMRLDPGLVPGGGPGRSRPRNRRRGGRAGLRRDQGGDGADLADGGSRLPRHHQCPASRWRVSPPPHVAGVATGDKACHGRRHREVVPHP